jgi:hypothetical protein
MTGKKPASRSGSASETGAGDESKAPKQPNRQLTPAAQRALAEAQARRAEVDRRTAEQPKELHGRHGPDPVRYGDWEVKGIASDF